MNKNPIINLLKCTWHYSLPKRNVIWVVVLTFLANVVLLLEPLVIGRVFNSIQFLPLDQVAVFIIIRNISFLLILTLIFWILHGISRTIERRNAFFVRKNYKNEMVDRVLDLSVAWHKDHHSGDTIDKINKASDSLYDYADNIFIIVEGFTRLFGAIAILVFYDWRSSIIALFFSFIAILTLIIFDKKLVNLYEKRFKAENFLASAVHDYISNIITIITLRLKQRVNTEMERRTDKIYPPYKKAALLNEFKWFSASFIISLIIISSLSLSAYFSFKTSGVVVIGTLFVLYQYLQNLGNTFYNFAWRYGEIVRANSAVEAAGVINEEYDKLKVNKKRSIPKNWKKLEIRNLCFAYEDEEMLDDSFSNIENVSIDILRGQKIAFIGESGSGKSTALAVLRGLYDTDTVDVFCDGKRLPFGLSHIRENVTLVPQDPEIFNSTIEDNITMGLAVSKNDLNEAIKMAHFQSVLKRLKNGLETNIMEKGVNLSGGEKQRLALARGILAAKGSEFLFLDEPTSSVDSENEMGIYEGIFSIFKDKSIISSVHKLHLLRYFDYIYYFSGGRIKAEGSLERLFEDIDFRELWNKYALNENNGKKAPDLDEIGING